MSSTDKSHFYYSDNTMGPMLYNFFSLSIQLQMKFV